jgi:hypothetical protein
VTRHSRCRFNFARRSMALTRHNSDRHNSTQLNTLEHFGGSKKVFFWTPSMTMRPSTSIHFQYGFGYKSLNLSSPNQVELTFKFFFSLLVLHFGFKNLQTGSFQSFHFRASTQFPHGRVPAPCPTS